MPIMTGIERLTNGMHLTWAGAMAFSAWMAHRQGRKRWSSWFVVLMIYWSAFMTNAAFDVYLESPMGGIWMWFFCRNLSSAPLVPAYDATAQDVLEPAHD